MRTIYPKLTFIPKTINFSEIEADANEDLDFEPVEEVDKFKRDTEDKLDTEILIMQMLNNLNDKEKIVFLFQLMRADGYRIDHESCSKIVHVTLRTYMNILKRVRVKTAVQFRQIYR